jgi:hypothetical protein
MRSNVPSIEFLCFLRFLLFQDEINTMHPLFTRADTLSGHVIDAATLVQRIMGPGLLESIYERCLIKLVDGIPRPVLLGANKPRTEGNEGNEAWEANQKGG